MGPHRPRTRRSDPLWLSAVRVRPGRHFQSREERPRLRPDADLGDPPRSLHDRQHDLPLVLGRQVACRYAVWVTYDEVLALASSMEDRPLETVTGRLFTVGVYLDSLVLTPASSGV